MDSLKKILINRIIISVSIMFVLLITVGTIAIYYHRKDLIQDGWAILKIENQSINNFIGHAIDDSLFFHDIFINELTFNERRSYQNVLSHMSKHLFKFHAINEQYDQIRFINQDGQEIIRFNWNKKMNSTRKVIGLQNKKHRYYFGKTMALNDNQVYISPLDFNVEYKHAIQPYEPTIRIGTPIVYAGKKIGMIILNIAMPYLIKQIEARDKLYQGNIILMNNRGYCVINPAQKYFSSKILAKENNDLVIFYPAMQQKLHYLKKPGLFNTARGIFLCMPVHYKTGKNVTSDLNASLTYFLPYDVILGLPLWKIGAIVFFFLIIAIFIGWLWGSLIIKQVAFENVLKTMARTDQLTELMNRYAFHEKLEEEKVSQMRYGYDLSIAMIDIDHFKKINDHYGHLIADEALKGFSQTLKNTFRKTDYICRFGGEEFIILLPHTNIDQAATVLEHLRLAVEKTTIIPEKNIQITISAAVTQWKSKTDTIDKILTRVDKLLYQAKNQGRNRVIVHQ